MSLVHDETQTPTISQKTGQESNTMIAVESSKKAASKLRTQPECGCCDHARFPQPPGAGFVAAEDGVRRDEVNAQASPRLQRQAGKAREHVIVRIADSSSNNNNNNHHNNNNNNNNNTPYCNPPAAQASQAASIHTEPISCKT